MTLGYTSENYDPAKHAAWNEVHCFHMNADYVAIELRRVLPDGTYAFSDGKPATMRFVLQSTEAFLELAASMAEAALKVQRSRALYDRHPEWERPDKNPAATSTRRGRTTSSKPAADS